MTKIQISLIAFASIFVGAQLKTTPALGNVVAVAIPNVLEAEAMVEIDPCGLNDVICPDEVPIEHRIRLAAREAGINEATALRIAKCESSLNPNAKNAHSSATGLYQFTTGTWRWIRAEADGLDRTNPYHSIAMFIKYYPRYPHWWECR